MWDDLDPKPKKPKPLDLAPLSIEDLNERVAELEAEIVRTKQAIADKTKQRDAAASIFKQS